MAEPMSNADWVVGDRWRLAIPAHLAALRAGGAEFLTQAFRAGGALTADNRVTQVTHLTAFAGGSTGHKALLSIEYEHAANLPTDLFVKFSRDFDDAIRDRAKNQLESEVALALLSASKEFPIAVPACLFADYHRASGTGLIITERIAFGAKGIERQYEKCMDYRMDAPLQHYRALLKALGALAGSHKAGRLAEAAALFPFDAAEAIARDRIRYSEEQLLKRVARYAEFASQCPRLLPRHIATPGFIEQLASDVPRFLRHEQSIKQYLHSRPEYIALCHWNANVDNAWFWRDACGELQCGLMDWGRVGQMNVALALFGALSAAETDLWDHHLHELLSVFVTEFERSAGPTLDSAELEFQLLLCIGLMTLAWLLDAPALIRMQLTDPTAIESRFDRRLVANETARVQLHMLTTVMNVWCTRKLGRALDRLLERL